MSTNSEVSGGSPGVGREPPHATRAATASVTAVTANRAQAAGRRAKNVAAGAVNITLLQYDAKPPLDIPSPPATGTPLIR
jgi:hypothetical protein